MTTTPEPITLQAVLARYGITKVKDLAQRAGISKQHAWGLMRATIGVGKVAAKRLHETLGIPTDELLAVAEVPCFEKRQALAGRPRPPRSKARPGRTPRRAPRVPAPVPVVEATPEPPTPLYPSPQERKAEMVARLQRMKAAGLSLAAIATQLNAEGVTTLSGRGIWRAGTIGNLLKEVTDA